MATTPVTTRNVHWENEASELSFASPLRDVSAQSIQYVNAQLVAHGFTHGAGIRLDALPGKDQQAALKCLVNMLGQRVVDMARTEELTTKYKTLAYDHERLVAQHTVALTTAATAERDVETAKARMDTMLKKLASEEDSHRKSREEFQKVKSSMQYLRQTTANELKRKEKEVEKMIDRLGKVSNDQIKLGTVGAGLACTNLLPDNPLPQDKHYLDVALNQSEAARLALLKENDALRDTILTCANALHSVHHTALASMTENEPEEPGLILSQTLFSATNGEQTQAMAAQVKLRNLFSQLRDSMAQITEDRDTQRRAKLTQQQELEELRDLAAEYEARLPMHGGYSSAQSTNFATIDLTAKEEDLARAMEQQHQELQALAEERNKFAEATTQLERDKVALEAERIRFLEEKAVFDKHSADNADDDRAPVFNRPCTPEPTLHTHRRVSSPKSPEQPRPRARRPSSPTPSAIPKHKSPTTKPIISRPKHDTPAEPEAVRPTTPPPPPVLRRSMSEHIHANLKEPSPPAFRPPSPIPAFLWDREPLELQDEGSPALTEDDLVMPYERDDHYPLFPESAILQGSRGPLRRSSETKGAQCGMAIPPHLKTPVRPLFSVPKKHKYSPVVPSPLSRIAMMGQSPSPPGSPEPAAIKKLQPVEEERTAELYEQFLHARNEADSGDEDIFSDDDSELCEDDLRGSSGSPLTHILNMGASPALAPLVSGFQFPGLFGPAPPLNLPVELPKPEAAPNKPTSEDGRGRVAVLEKADNANRAHRTERPQHAAKGSKKSSSSSNGSDSGSSGSDTYAKGRPASALSIRPKPSRTTTAPRPVPTAKGRFSDKSEKENAGNKLVPLRKTSGVPHKSAPGIVKPTSRPPSVAAVSRKIPAVPGAASRPTAPNRNVKRS